LPEAAGRALDFTAAMDDARSWLEADGATAG